jgi:hypothetical protein
MDITMQSMLMTTSMPVAGMGAAVTAAEAEAAKHQFKKRFPSRTPNHVAVAAVAINLAVNRKQVKRSCDCADSKKMISRLSVSTKIRPFFR